VDPCRAPDPRQAGHRESRLATASSRLRQAVASLAAAIDLSSGWRRRGVAFAAGAGGALALPPFSIFLMMILPMTVAVWLIDGCRERRKDRFGGFAAAFGAGWWMGFGYFIAGLWWLGAAFLVDADQFAWALPLGVIALPAGLALFWGSGFGLAALLWSGDSLRIFALAFALGGAEWARGLVLTGFPWNDLGMALGANLNLAQAASVVGLHGLTFLSIAIFAAPATLRNFSPGRALWAPTLLAAGVLALLALFGFIRLAAPPSAMVADVNLRLVQANISQGAFFAPNNRDAILARYFALSNRDIPGGRQAHDVTHLIWPESAFPFILSRDEDALAQITEFLRHGQTLTTGAARMEQRPGEQPIYFNAIGILTAAGLSSERYDKQHLVPFGEYVPLGALVEKTGITQFVHIPGGFTAGTTRRVLNIPGLPEAAPLVCYEAIFPVEIGDVFSGARRPEWLLNVTDDAWFGDTAGPHQHYAQARLRAIELGLPMVRAANSGISAVVDGFGRDVATAPLGVEAVVDSGLPQPLAATWQARFGSLGAAALALAALSLALAGKRNDSDNRRL
jgi:apolipoprotein N-acyltransferase